MKTYYGQQTKKAQENFSFENHTTQLELIYAITHIKKAAALAHRKIGEIDKKIADSIISVCDEILNGKHDAQFVTIAIQGGAGTSINMNVNEVIANRANKFLRNTVVHPNDHVNKSQSTNDVNPSALKIVCIQQTRTLLKVLDELINVLETKAHEYKDVAKLARTHMQDAVPTTFGEEFSSYAAVLKRDKARIQHVLPFLYDLNLGGTAIGNSVNASKKYIDEVYVQLRNITGIKELKKADNLMSLTSSQTDFYQLSAAIVALFIDLSKMATDIRFMASGPRGGIGEIILESLQPGSSIMPGKINPIIPESINQIYYYISGKNITIEHAAEGAHLELGIMFPVLADSIISSLKISTSAVFAFSQKCFATLKISKENSRKHLENSAAYATLLVPILGYDVVSSVVKDAIKNNKTIRRVILEKRLLSNKQLDLLMKDK